MSLEEFRKAAINLKAAYENAVAKGISLAKPPIGKVYDYKTKKEEYYRTAVSTAVEILKSKASGLSGVACNSPDTVSRIDSVMKIIKEIDSYSNKGASASRILELISGMGSPSSERLARPKKLPLDIRDEVIADIEEMEKCLQAGCLRSTVILCGRLLETALHRKYFEVTGNDALEKSPGIGLGNLIAKLKEQNVELDPALTNQVHLINQVRISSVHVKKDAFRPSAQQAQAIVLYTMDILGRIFA